MSDAIQTIIFIMALLIFCGAILCIYFIDMNIWRDTHSTGEACIEYGYAEYENKTKKRTHFHAVLPINTRIRPSKINTVNNVNDVRSGNYYDDHDQNEQNTDNNTQYHIYSREPIDLIIKSNILITYNDVKFILVGDYVLPHDRGNYLDKNNHNPISESFIDGLCGDVDVHIDAGTLYSIDKTLDPIGLTKCLRAKQAFKIQPGSTIDVNAGTTIYLKNDIFCAKFVTTEKMIGCVITN